MIIKIAGIDMQDVWTGTAGEDLIAYDLCYIGADGKYYKASAANENTMPGIVLSAEATVKDGIGNFIRNGRVTNNAWSFIVGQQVHAGVIPGSLMQGMPESNQQLQKIGIALAVNQIDFNPNILLLEIA